MASPIDAAALHRDAVVADTHNDLLMLVARRPRTRQASYFRERWLPQLRDGGVDVQVLPVYIDDDFRPEGALRQTLRMIEAGHRVIEGNGDAIALCLSGADIDDALATGRTAAVLALEGCEAVGYDVGLLETVFRLGVRMASFTHFGRTALADGSAEDDAGSRLTSVGVEALSLMEHLGMLVDVSHLSASGTDHVLEIATRPVVATHSSAYAIQAHHRNLTDERLKGIARTGGVVGVNFFYGFIDPAQPTLDRLVDHIEHVASVAGIDHVGLGPDFIHEVFQELPLPPGQEGFDGFDDTVTLPGLEGPAGLPLVTAQLVDRGWAESDIRRVLGENWLRVFRADLGVPASG